MKKINLMLCHGARLRTTQFKKNLFLGLVFALFVGVNLNAQQVTYDKVKVNDSLKIIGNDPNNPDIILTGPGTSIFNKKILFNNEVRGTNYSWSINQYGSGTFANSKIVLLNNGTKAEIKITDGKITLNNSKLSVLDTDGSAYFANKNVDFSSAGLASFKAGANFASGTTVDFTGANVTGLPAVTLDETTDYTANNLNAKTAVKIGSDAMNPNITLSSTGADFASGTTVDFTGATVTGLDFDISGVTTGTLSVDRLPAAIPASKITGLPVVTLDETTDYTANNLNAKTAVKIGSDAMNPNITLSSTGADFASGTTVDFTGATVTGLDFDISGVTTGTLSVDRLPAAIPASKITGLPAVTLDETTDYTANNLNAKTAVKIGSDAMNP
ncbi:hypothetical protein V8G61_13110, partial [Gaetbulibacter sp. M240]|uniref:hypothetical protein n=1 Tax=Gaetbulibacter sp. M240 TaxID=3126511 RepID=UPI00374EEA79